MIRRFNLRWTTIRSFLFLSLLSYLFLPVTSSQATSLLLLSDQQLVEQSTLFVRGTVIEKRCVWAPQKIAIVTLVKIRVAEEIFNRPAPAEITIRHFGGQIGETKMQMPDGVSFKIGEEVLVAVARSKYLPKNEYLLVGMTQGKWTILPNDAPAKKYHTRFVRRAFDHAPAHVVADKNQKQLPKIKNAPQTLGQLIAHFRLQWKNIQLQRKKKAPIVKKPPLNLHPVKTPKIPNVKKAPLLFTPAPKKGKK